MDPGYPVEDVRTSPILGLLMTYVFVNFFVTDRSDCNPHG